MSAVTALVAVRAGATGAQAVVAPLAVAEARHLLRHPLTLAGAAVCAVAFVIVAPSGGRNAYGIITTLTAMWLGVPAYFAANLVASWPRRYGAEEHLATTPAGQAVRTAGLLLASFAPALVAGVLVAAGLVGQAVGGGPGLPEQPTVAELVSGPVVVLGGGLLGVAVARWFAFPGAAMLVMVGLVAFTVWASNSQRYAFLGFYVDYPVWSDDPQAWLGRHPGSAAWHVAYLAALGGLAAVAALLRHASRRRTVLLAAGAVLAAAAAAAGGAQLP